MFRKNVAALVKCQEKYLGCFRSDYGSWQCVQGGVELYDRSFEIALQRELYEELSLSSDHFMILQRSRFWRRYFFSTKEIKFGLPQRHVLYLGQEQLWFLVEIDGLDRICLERSSGEFSKVALFDLPDLLGHYPLWKRDPFFDFCRELHLI